MSSFGRKIADLINDQGKLKQSKVDGIDSSEVTSVISSEVSAGVSYFDTLDSLPTTELSSGLKALVRLSSTEGRLYVYNGDGWYNANTNLNTSSPVWVTEPNATYEIEDSATPLIITALVNDGDGDPVSNESFVSDSAQYMVDITNDSSVWTFTPKTKSQIATEVAAGNLTDSNGDFVYTFKWSDGFNFIQKATTITYNPSGWQGIPWGGTRGILAGAGGSGGTPKQQIEYWTMSTGGTAQSFGNLTGVSKDMSGGMSNNTRIVFGSRNTDASHTFPRRTMDYITPATLGNAIDFGDDIDDYYGGSGASSNGTVGVQIGGNLPTGNPYPNNYSANMQKMRKLTIATAGNATLTGDMSKKLYAIAAAGDATRGLFAGGVNRTNWSGGSAVSVNDIKYYSYATANYAYDFGDLNGMGGGAWDNVGGVSDETRSIFAGGYVRTNYYQVQQTAYAANANVIHYVTTQSTSNANDFGDLVYWSYLTSGGCTDGTTGQFAGGFGKLTSQPYSTVDIIQKITIQTTGNASDFGDISQTNHGSNGAGA